MIKEIRNLAIIAHVDHGKTTLLDSILKQSGSFRANQQVAERAMDSNDLERERGITILAKCTSIEWNNVKINIIDTPGHADFGGEVERVLHMADGVLLLVDSAEGCLPQTKFVLGKALKLGMLPIVIVNKIDRSDARPEEVLNEIFDLFLALEATDEQCDFPVFYASGRNGWAVRNLNDERKDLTGLLDFIIEKIPTPKLAEGDDFKMLATILERDNFLGRVLTGKIMSGTAKVNSNIKALNLENNLVENFRITRILNFQGLDRIPVQSAIAGDIICLAGMTKATVSDSLVDLSVEESLPSPKVAPPTMAVTVSVNSSPLAGTEGKKLTSTMIRDRLKTEAERNIAIRFQETEGKDAFEIAGRGELQLGILFETMRREGFEFSISRPRVIFDKDENGDMTEPYEEIIIDCDEEYAGLVVEKLSVRKCVMSDMRQSGKGRNRMVFLGPSRALIGFQNQFLSDTRGTGIFNRLYHSYGAYKGEISGRRNGALISTGDGEAVAYALFNLQDRGIMFVEHGDKVYQGMIVGEHTRDNDLEINVLKGKQLTNVRASGKDENILLEPARKMPLEELMSYINDDELVEITPKTLRLRKTFLSPNDRSKAARQAKSANQ